MSNNLDENTKQSDENAERRKEIEVKMDNIMEELKIKNKEKGHNSEEIDVQEDVMIKIDENGKNVEKQIYKLKQK